jgi:hypothetical protein
VSLLRAQQRLESNLSWFLSQHGARMPALAA